MNCTIFPYLIGVFPLAMLLAFPAMYIIVDLHRWAQLFWVILLFSLMCLSEFIICENVIRGEQLVSALSNVIRNNISAIDHALEIHRDHSGCNQPCDGDGQGVARGT